MKWKAKLLGILVVALLCIGSYNWGERNGMLVAEEAFTIGIQVGKQSTNNKIKRFCDTGHGMMWGEQKYYCAPATTL